MPSQFIQNTCVLVSRMGKRENAGLIQEFSEFGIDLSSVSIQHDNLIGVSISKKLSVILFQ